jgi:putative addiction module component (TIGR02574 family)
VSDIQSILSSAKQLSVGERLELIDALWETVPSADLPPLTDEWRSEIQRRSAELDAGTAPTVPWGQVREEAFRRNGIDAGN